MLWRQRRTVLLALLLSLTVEPTVAQPAASDRAAAVDFARAVVDTLTAARMAGRSYRRGGDEQAARYLERQFKQHDLGAVSDRYEQPFRVRADVFPEAPALAVNGRSLELGKTFLPMSSTASGVAKQVPRVVAVGHGLVLPEQGVDAYAGRIVKGTVVVIDSGAPDSLRHSDAVPAQALSRPARIQHAEVQGARAVIWLRDRLSLSGASPYDAAIPVFQVRRPDWPASVRRVSYDVAHRRDQPFQTQNVMGQITGTVHPDSVILLTAHYDHLGALGDSVYFAGANDNASGVAMLLTLARYFDAHRPACTLVFVAFSGEEIGLVGSQYFAARPPFDLHRAAFLLNFDMVASGTKGITAVAGADYPRAFSKLRATADSLGTGSLSKRKNAPNSDHFFLIKQGVPGFYLYTREGKQPYHSTQDVPRTLEWNDFWQVYRLARGFIKRRCAG